MIGDVIKHLRTEHNITQQDLAQLVGVKTSTVGMYETGARQPSYEIIIKIADYFSVSTDYLLGRIQAELSADEAVIAKEINMLTLEEKKVIRTLLNYMHNKSWGIVD